jgi:hypothetical protein
MNEWMDEWMDGWMSKEVQSEWVMGGYMYIYI